MKHTAKYWKHSFFCKLYNSGDCEISQLCIVFLETLLVWECKNFVHVYPAEPFIVHIYPTEPYIVHVYPAEPLLFYHTRTIFLHQSSYIYFMSIMSNLMWKTLFLIYSLYCLSVCCVLNLNLQLYTCVSLYVLRLHS